jgi:hypothetical protein
MDAELRRVETLREFGARRMTNAMPATMTVKGISQRVEATFGPDGLAVMGIEKRNHPEVAPTLIATFDRLIAESSADWSITLSFPTPNMRLAAIGWLRAAYLVAFAALGYGYIVRRELDVVREQIRAPREPILKRFCLMTRDGAGFAERRILLARVPAELESTLVFSNECAVFLPSAESDGTYERIERVDPWPPGESRISGKSVPWPTKPVFGFDRPAVGMASWHR